MKINHCGEKKKKKERICLCHTYLNDGNIKKKQQENTTEFQIQLEMPMSSKAQDCVYSLYFKKQCNTHSALTMLHILKENW